MEVPLRGFRGLERFRAGKRQAWTPIKSHGCGLGMPVAKKDKFHTCGGPRRRPCLGEGRGRRIFSNIGFVPQTTQVRALIKFASVRIFENQTRLRENIKSMEHVRTGSLLERYMNDMDKEENDLIETRKRIEASEEQNAKLSNDASRLALQIVMKTKALQKRAKC